MQLLLTLFLNIILHIPVTATNQCFNVHPSHAISNAEPIVELFETTAGECLNYCISHAIEGGCVSVVHHRNFGTCQLYGHDGTQNNAKVVFVDTHDLYIRSSWQKDCQGPKNAPKMYAETISPHQKPINFGIVQNNSNTYASDFNSPPTMNAPLFPQMRSRNGIHYSSLQTTELPLWRNDLNSVAATSRSRKLTTASSQDTESECGTKEKFAYFVLYGFKLSSESEPQVLRGVDQSSCIMYCSQNINSIGNKIPCYSANYDPSNEVCQMYNERSKHQDNWAFLEPSEKFTFINKFCIQTKKYCASESTYTVHLFQQIHKKIISYVPGLNTKTACLAECIDDRECKAVTYKPGLCILHSESPSTDSSIAVKGSDQTMIIENGCQLSASAVPAPSKSTSTDDDSGSWQEWTLCQFGSKGRRIRVRHRDCDDCSEDLQFEDC